MKIKVFTEVENYQYANNAGVGVQSKYNKWIQGTYGIEVIDISYSISDFKSSGDNHMQRETLVVKYRDV